VWAALPSFVKFYVVCALSLVAWGPI
jgi:hypothetical protein